MLKVGDIMTRNVLTFRRAEAVGHATWALATDFIGGAPVLGDDGAVVGVLSKSDLLDRVHGGLTPASVTIGEVMSTEVVCAAPEESALSAARTMVERGVHRLLVLDDNGGLVGIVTSMDIVKAVARLENFSHDDL